jgi:hypothetical protein
MIAFSGDFIIRYLDGVVSEKDKARLQLVPVHLSH